MAEGTLASGATAPTPEAQANRAGIQDAPVVKPAPMAPEAPTGPDKVTPQGEVSPESVNSEPTDTDTPSTMDWDSEENPYKYAAAQHAQQLQQVQQFLLAQQLQGEARSLKDEGYTDEQVQQHLALRVREAAVAQATGQLQNTARLEVARVFAGKLAEAGVQVSQEELLKDSNGVDVTSPEAMQARAQALWEERRKSTFQSRKGSGADKVGPDTPRAQPGDTERYSRMTPQQKIAHGLRQQRGE